MKSPYDPILFMKHYLMEGLGCADNAKTCYDLIDAQEPLIGSRICRDVIYPVLWWMCTREPARVLVICHDEEARERADRYFYSHLATSEEKLPFHEEQFHYQKLDEKGCKLGRSYVLFKLATTEGLLGHCLSRSSNVDAKGMVIYYQCPPEQVRQLMDRTDTWTDRTVIVNEVIQPGS